MVNVFSGSEIVEMGINIEKNGRDFYRELVKSSKSKTAQEVFGLLAREEESHIKTFEGMLSTVKKYEPSEAYPGEYFAYIKSLASEYVFTKENKGLDIAKSAKGDLEAIQLGIGFEKDSILFYSEMKKFVLKGEQKIVDRLLEEEKIHLRKLNELKGRL